MIYRKATPDDLDAIKTLFDKHKLELGFVVRSSLARSIGSHEIIVAVDEQDSVLAGVVQFRHRRDNQTTLYNIVVDPRFKGEGIGTRLIDELRQESSYRQKTAIVLKCPEDLSANAFYEKYGFLLAMVEDGKKRPLKIWKLVL